MNTIRCFLFAAFVAGFTASAHADWLWTRQIIPGVGAILDIAYGNGMFVAGTNTGYLLRTHDGVNWTASRPTTRSIDAIAFGDDRFVASVAAISSSKNKLIYSSDGIRWTFARRAANTGRFSSKHNLTVLASKGGSFIGLGPNVQAFASSTNGRRWKNPLDGKKPAKYAGSVSGLAARGGYVLSSTAAGATIQTSPNGLSWTTRFSGSSRGPARGIAAGKPGKRVICVGENGLCLISNDRGMTWKSKHFGSQDLLGIADANRQFVAFTDKRVYSTTTGISWTRQLHITRGGDHLRAIAGGAGLYIAVGKNAKNGLVLASSGLPGPSERP